ncbi:DUF4387 domain-containing protein [Pseudarthrobacter sp. J75]|uniref:DUF4387 domain-containing protein n=1 Tax=unclassified Pseudarthrobacter TaxID=2647000 RepID=UPI002E7FB68A|nr:MULTISPECIES: DUF4387 domain-containing protein [unclassified Pseudarthrobacter]MEE2522443.1 DUF4387 domain-containing protein [Pseudarthrobacter sp. J47]MEE2529226.1 DUF4387 domain-containing protein [Pseudarthrobacter sp. J75]
MATLGSLARLIRSKNAGPWMLTIDIMLPDRSTFQRVVNAQVLDKALIGRLFGISPEDAEIYHYAPANAIKVSFPRDVPNGHPLDRDLFGGQQFAALVDLDIPDVPQDSDVVAGSAAGR